MTSLQLLREIDFLPSPGQVGAWDGAGTFAGISIDRLWLWVEGDRDRQKWEFLFKPFGALMVPDIVDGVFAVVYQAESSLCIEFYDFDTNVCKEVRVPDVAVDDMWELISCTARSLGSWNGAHIACVLSSEGAMCIVDCEVTRTGDGGMDFAVALHHKVPTTLEELSASKFVTGSVPAGQPMGAITRAPPLPCTWIFHGTPTPGLVFATCKSWEQHKPRMAMRVFRDFVQVATASLTDVQSVIGWCGDAVLCMSSDPSKLVLLSAPTGE